MNKNTVLALLALVAVSAFGTACQKKEAPAPEAAPAAAAPAETAPAAPAEASPAAAEPTPAAAH